MLTRIFGSKVIYKIIICYCVIALCLSANFGTSYMLEDENINYDYHNSNITYPIEYDEDEQDWIRVNYEDMIPEVQYSQQYKELTYESNSETFNRLVKVGEAISELGESSIYAFKVETGVGWLDKIANLFILPFSITYNLCRLITRVIDAIAGIDYDINFNNDNYNIWWMIFNSNNDGHGGAFSGGTSYGGGGGGFHGGR